MYIILSWYYQLLPRTGHNSLLSTAVVELNFFKEQNTAESSCSEIISLPCSNTAWYNYTRLALQEHHANIRNLKWFFAVLGKSPFFHFLVDYHGVQVYNKIDKRIFVMTKNMESRKQKQRTVMWDPRPFAMKVAGHLLPSCCSCRSEKMKFLIL